MGRRPARRHTGAVEIYLVDDSPRIVHLLGELLGTIDGVRTVGSAARAEDAIREVLALRPDLVLCDIGLAQGSGFDVLCALREQAPEVEVCMLSNFASEPYRRHAARLGARDFFDKSTELDRMRDNVAARASGAH